MESDRFAAARLWMTTESERRRMTSRTSLLGLAALTAGGCAFLGSQLEFDDPTELDRGIRRLAQQRELDPLRVALKPLFPLGLPGGYITIAYLTARWMKRRHKHGSRAIVTAAWLGWLVHRAIKLGYFRERPRRPGVRRRVDSYPSGHTTGATALAVATALVLEQEGLISRRHATAIPFGAAVMMGAYRVVADDHWTTDVLGGWMLGTAIGLTCYAALGKQSRRAPRVVQSKTVIRELESSAKRPRRRARPA
jgi:membrane-associated phospholipid phosphatase